MKRKKKSIEGKLKKQIRNKSKIKSENSLKEYIYKLLMEQFSSLESIIQKMSDKIYQDFKSKSSKTKTKKLWEYINDELLEYNQKGYFNYKLVSPQNYASNYDIAFVRFNKNKDNNKEKYIYFDSLSSGEKIIFELICYYFVAKDSDLEMIMLDEFDANLNPSLAKKYVQIIKEKFKNIKIILTTHSPSTVVEILPEELFELKESNELKCANNEEGKRDILKRLAPQFVYYGEFGVLESIFNQKYELIVFVEGKNDVSNFEKYLKNYRYKFIECKGACNMPDLVKTFKVIPFFKDLVKNKNIVFLFDFDQEGISNLENCLPKGISNQTLYTHYFNNKQPFIKPIEENMQVYVTHLVPSEEHSWELESQYRHQELKNEGEKGIKRQIEHLESIINKKSDISSNR